MVRQMDDLVTGDDGGDLYRLDRNQSFLNQGLDEDISKSKEGDEVEELTHGVSLLADESVHITPGFFQVFRGQAKQAACMIYYSRRDAGTPRISPKAGNMVSGGRKGEWGGGGRGVLCVSRQKDRAPVVFCLSLVRPLWHGVRTSTIAPSLVVG